MAYFDAIIGLPHEHYCIAAFAMPSKDQHIVTSLAAPPRRKSSGRELPAESGPIQGNSADQVDQYIAAPSDLGAWIHPNRPFSMAFASCRYDFTATHKANSDLWYANRFLLCSFSGLFANNHRVRRKTATKWPPLSYFLIGLRLHFAAPHKAERAQPCQHQRQARRQRDRRRRKV